MNTPKMQYIPRIGDRIPLRAKQLIDTVTLQVREIVTAPHEKGNFIEEAGRLVSEGKMSRDEYIRIVSGFFR